MDLIDLFVDDVKGMDKKVLQIYVISAFSTAFLFSLVLILSEDIRNTYYNSIGFYLLIPLILGILEAFFVLLARSKIEPSSISRSKLEKYYNLDISLVEFVPLTVSFLLIILLSLFFWFLMDIFRI